MFCMALTILRRVIGVALLAVALASPAQADSIPRGEVIDAVKCASDPAQSYALYLPSSYSPERPAPLLVGFHPAARGRAIVELYRDAAETYGYIVAVSNNSRNGPWEGSLAAAKAMLGDVGQRFAIDLRRVYITGMSGGARVALGLALGTKDLVAGVIASSASYPDGQTRKSLPFVVFGTAGTEDFNYLEMRLLDRTLTTPHRLAVFDGGHTLPPAAIATEAIEWLELNAIKSGRRPRDEALIDRLLGRREAAAAAAAPLESVHLLQNLADDFNGLRDVSQAKARASELAKQKDLKNALTREREDVDAELRLMNDLATLEAGLRENDTRDESWIKLRETLSRCALQAGAQEDSIERRRARRVLRGLMSSASQRVQDPEYLKLLEHYRSTLGAPPQRRQ
jgi:poly(3-hydroxybutyrate) depolymerase